MSISFTVGIVVIITWGIYFIVIGASGVIADKVAKNLKEERPK